MPQPPAVYAKLTPPRTIEIVPRERCFQRLDALEASPVVWIWGPPGFGKTALLASYVHARALRPLWYQLDSDDIDLASFFFYLGVGSASLCRREKARLPLLTPEYLGDLRGFSRSFFRELFARMPKHGVLVLDNVQEADHSAPFIQALRDGFGEIPSSVRVLVLSRSPPPEILARLQVNRMLAVLDWETLAFTHDETQALADQIADIEPTVVDDIHQRTQGWVAGIILLLEYLRRKGVRQFPQSEGAGREALFDYFASEIFATLSPSACSALARLAFLPHFSDEAVRELTDNSEIADLLANLYRRRLFVHRRAEPPRYEFHPLFREFLLSRARTLHSTAELGRFLEKAALLMERDGEIQRGAELYAEAGAWQECCRLVCQQAGALLGQGRSRMLESMIALIPSALVEAQPWLLYWRALTLLPVDPVASRTLLERAFPLFKQAGDAAGCFLAMSSALRTYYYERASFLGVDAWLAELDVMLSRHPDCLSPEIEAQVLAAGIVVLYRRPDHPLLSHWAGRAMLLLRRGVGPYEFSGITDFVLGFYSWHGEVALAQDALNEFDRLIDSNTASPLICLALEIWGSLVAFLSADHAGACVRLDQASAIVRQHGLGLFETPIHCNRVYPLLGAGNLAQAEAILTNLEARLQPGRILDLCFFHHLRSALFLLQGLPARARHDSEIVLTLVEESGIAFHAALQRTILIPALIALRDYDGAQRELVRLTAFAEAMPAPMLHFDALLCEAELLLERGGPRQAVIDRLECAFTHGAAHDYMNTTVVWIPSRMSQLCALALEHRIETDYVTRLIRKHCLPPPDPTTEIWPWPVQIRTLGNFSLQVGGRVPTRTGKAQKRTLDLLKAVIGFGCDEVGIERLTDLLWPDADGAAARSAFDMAVHRLRRLLGCEDALIVREGKLSVNPMCCWVDARSLAQYLDEAESMIRTLPAADDLVRMVTKIRRLYRGDFLANEPDQPWLFPLREMLKRRMLRQLAAIGRCFEAAGQWQRAIDLYERGLDRDPCIEEFYRRLILCHDALGHPSGVLATYHRCRDMLAHVLGATPSAETRTLFESIVCPSVSDPLDQGR